MLYDELKEKLNNINEVKIHTSETYFEYNYKTDNKELEEFIEFKLQNIKIDDGYKVSQKFYKGIYIDEIIDTIKNMKTYDELIKLFNNPLVNKPHCKKYKTQDKIKEIRLEFLKPSVAEFIYNQIKNLDNINITNTGLYHFTIKSDVADIKEQCKHTCKTNIRKHEIEELFNL